MKFRFSIVETKSSNEQAVTTYLDVGKNGQLMLIANGEPLIAIERSGRLTLNEEAVRTLGFNFRIVQ